MSPHTVLHICIHFFAAATNSQKNQIITTPGAGIAGQLLLFQMIQGVCFKDGLERAGVKGAPGVLPPGFAAQFAVMLSNMNLLQHNKLN